MQDAILQQIDETVNEKPYNLLSAYELSQMEFPPAIWLILNILTAGLTILAGRPKSGKSWLALNFAAAIAYAGKALGTISVDKHTVLYIGLEDTLRRLNSRLEMMIEQGKQFPENLLLTTEFPAIKENGIEYLQEIINDTPDLKLIVIDTLEKFIKRNGRESYSEDYLVTAELQKIAIKNNIAIVVIHHTRKMQTDVPLDDVSGTSGLTGAADTIMVLRKHKGIDTLSIKGRDMEEVEFALDFKEGLWISRGKYDEIAHSTEQQNIIDLLNNESLTASEISEQLDKKITTVRMALSRMVKANLIKKDSGVYSV